MIKYERIRRYFETDEDHYFRRKSETKKVWDTLLVMVGKSNHVRGQPDSDDNTTLRGWIQDILLKIRSVAVMPVAVRLNLSKA
jgi:hypothetical protein